MYTLVIYGKIISRKNKINDICRNNSKLIQNVNIVKCCFAYEYEIPQQENNYYYYYYYYQSYNWICKRKVWGFIDMFITPESFWVCSKPGPVFLNLYFAVISNEMRGNKMKDKKYHTVETVIKKYHTVETVIKNTTLSKQL